MKFYIATGLKRRKQHNLIRDMLLKAGHEITFDWTIHASGVPKNDRENAEVVDRELQGVAEADIVIVLLPGGNGTHAELGVAAYLGKTTLIHAKSKRDIAEKDIIYWHKNASRVYGTLEEFGQTVVAIMDPDRKPVFSERVDLHVWDHEAWDRSRPCRCGCNCKEKNLSGVDEETDEERRPVENP